MAYVTEEKAEAKLRKGNPQPLIIDRSTIPKTLVAGGAATSKVSQFMETCLSSHTQWLRLPNGNVMHRCGIELTREGQQWRMTDESDHEFAWFAIREQGLTHDEARELAELLIEQGAYWAEYGMH